MSKPLTTLGDALAAKGGNWRAEMRAADIPTRRESPQSRPDRGYVEQPEERVVARAAPTTTQFPRRREETPVLTAPVALIRFTRDPEPVLETPENRPPEPEKEPHPMAGTELNQYDEPDHGEADESHPEHAEHFASGIPPLSDAERLDLFDRASAPRRTPRGKDRKKRVSQPLPVRIEAAKRFLRGEKMTDIAAELEVSDSSVSLWVKQFRAGHMPQPVYRTTALPQPIEKEKEMPRATPASKKRKYLPPAVKLDAVQRIIAGTITTAAAAKEIGAGSSNITRWVQVYKKTGKVPGYTGHESAGPASYTMVSNGRAAPRSFSGPPSIPGDAPPLPTIRVGGFDNPTFELHGLQAYLEYMIRLGVKAELNRRLAGD